MDTVLNHITCVANHLMNCIHQTFDELSERRMCPNPLSAYESFIGFVCRWDSAHKGSGFRYGLRRDDHAEIRDFALTQFCQWDFGRA